MKNLFYGNFEQIIVDEMLKENLNPLNKDDINFFWANKLPEEMQDTLLYDS
jgi:hypothetical protein